MAVGLTVLRQGHRRITALVVVSCAVICAALLAGGPGNAPRSPHTVALRTVAPSPLPPPPTTTSTSTTLAPAPPTQVLTPSGSGNPTFVPSNVVATVPVSPTTSPIAPTTIPATTTTTAAPVTASPAANCGGDGPDVGGTWTCTFDDEFDGTALDTTKWIAQQTSDSGYHSGNECYVDNPANVSVANGQLDLTAIDQAPFTCVDPDGNYTTDETSGMVSTDHHFSQTYGLFEVRAAFPSSTVPGLQSTLWLWPQNSRAYGLLWPASGEIDFAEWYSQYADLDIPYIHYNKSLGDGDQTTADCALSDPSSFHTYGVEWTPTSLTILLDGAVCMTDNWTPSFPESKPAPFNLPFFVVLTQALGIDSNAFTPGSAPPAATTQIDWVRVWS